MLILFTVLKRCAPFAEWMLSGPTDPLYGYNIQFANTTGFSVLDFMLNRVIRDVFGKGYGFDRLNDTIEETNKDYDNPYKLITFIDNHDMPRFLSINYDKDKMHEAIAFIMTSVEFQLYTMGQSSIFTMIQTAEMTLTTDQ